MTQKRIWTLALLAAALTVTLTSSSLVLGKGKPGGGDPPPEPPPDLPAVRYRIDFPLLPANSDGEYMVVNDINNEGEIVGMYTTATGNHVLIHYAGDAQASDLNDLVEGEFPRELGCVLDLRSMNGESSWELWSIRMETCIPSRSTSVLRVLSSICSLTMDQLSPTDHRSTRTGTLS